MGFCVLTNATISFAISISDGLPNMTTLPFSSLIILFISSTNLSGNHLFADPYVAPGLTPIRGRWWSGKEDRRRFLAHCLSSSVRYM